MYKFKSTKTYTHAQGLSCAFRQWRAESHCRYLHGYALQVKLTFEGDLDANHWVMDFGGLKVVKTWLERKFDHKTLVAGDDPHILQYCTMRDLGLMDLVIIEAVGIEAFAKEIFKFVSAFARTSTAGRVKLTEVEVSEHEGNSAICQECLI